MTAPPSPRRLALKVLREIERTRGFSNRVLSDHLERNLHLAPRDRGFVTALVYGVLRSRNRLDHLIDACADRPARIKGEVRELLRLATFELVELGHPAHVASSEAVKLARRLDPGDSLVAMVTAVLAGITRSATQLEQAMAVADPIDALEQRWSIPRWLAGRWLRALGPARALARARALADPPSVDLRVDLSHGSAQEVRALLLAEHPEAQVDLVEGQPQCLRTRGAGDLFYRPAHEQGLVSVQSLGSQRAALALAPAAGARVLDACAGLGTKTLHLAELMARRGALVAVDRDAERLASLDDQLERGHASSSALELRVVHGDLVEVLADEQDFDAILLDAPCTGLGNLGRHPELRHTSAFADLARCAELQDRLLDACVARLRPGGRLVYCVCSLEAEESDARVDRALTRHPLRCDLREIWTPEEHGCDGFFLARLLREPVTTAAGHGSPPPPRAAAVATFEPA